MKRSFFFSFFFLTCWAIDRKINRPTMTTTTSSVNADPPPPIHSTKPVKEQSASRGPTTTTPLNACMVFSPRFQPYFFPPSSFPIVDKSQFVKIHRGCLSCQRSFYFMCVRNLSFLRRHLTEPLNCYGKRSFNDHRIYEQIKFNQVKLDNGCRFCKFELCP